MRDHREHARARGRGPSRCGSVRPAWRPTAARTPAMLTPDASVGIVSATQRDEPADDRRDANVAGPGSGARQADALQRRVEARPPATSSIASHGAAITAGTTTSSASPNAIADEVPGARAARPEQRGLGPAPLEEQRRDEDDRVAASTPNWTSSSRIPAWATRTERSTDGEDRRAASW